MDISGFKSSWYTFFSNRYHLATHCFQIQIILIYTFPITIGFEAQLTSKDACSDGDGAHGCISKA